MAEVLSNFEFTEPVGKSAYPWDKLLDGQIHKLAEDSDFKCKIATFRLMAAKQARKKGKTVRVNKVEGGLVIQAVEATAEQKAKWAAEQSNGQAPTTPTEPEVPPQPSPAPVPPQVQPSKGKKGKK